MNNLYILIENSKMNDTESMEKLCNQFFPLMKKYAIKLNYEDSYNDLRLCFIECILKIPLDSGNFVLSDAYILSYIKKSIYFKYIALSKKLQENTYRNITYDNDDFILDKITYKENLGNLEDELFKTDIRNILTDKEFNICILKFIYRYTDKEIAERYGVSRQAINKTVNKLKQKLWVYYSKSYS